VIDFDTPEGREHPFFQDYLKDRFGIRTTSGGVSLPMTLDSTLMEEESMTLELTVEIPRGLDKLYIYQSLLTDIFPDQKNLVIFSSGNTETGIEFDVARLEQLVTIE
jgi:hypothetical protein